MKYINYDGLNHFLEKMLAKISVILNGYVPTSRTINSKSLSSNITLSASDVGALPSSTTIPSIDSTLKVNGAAANAKTVGDNIDSINTEIETIAENVAGISCDSIGAAPKSHSHAYMEFSSGQFIQGANIITQQVKDALNVNISVKSGSTLPSSGSEGDVFFKYV